MRFGNIDNSDSIHDLLQNPLFAAVFTWLTKHPNPVPREKPYSIIEGVVSARVIEYNPGPREKGTFETHHNFVDLQVCLGPNSELIFIANSGGLTQTEDDSHNDVTLYKTPSDALHPHIVNPGDFIIFDVEKDAHMPQRVHQSTAPNRKVVFKIRRTELPADIKI